MMQLRDESEYLEIVPERFLETCRVLVIKPSKEGKTQILTCSNQSNLGNRKGKDEDKKGKTELPGGKVFDNDEEQRLFLEKNPDQQEVDRVFTAANELEQETGLYINPNRFKRINSVDRKMIGRFEKIPGVDHIRTNFYLVVLNPEEYEKPPQNWTAQEHSDDRHERTAWEELDLQDFSSGGSLDWFIAKNSLLEEDTVEQAEAAIAEQLSDTRAKVTQVATTHNSIIRGAEVTTSDTYSKTREKGTQKASAIDFNRDQPLDYEEFCEAYRVHFGTALDVQEVNRNIKHILQNYCIPQVSRRVAFMQEYSEARGQNPIENSKRVKRHLQTIVERLQTPKGFYRFYTRANKSKLGRRLMKSFFGFGKISQLPYFDYINAYSSQFNGALSAETEKDNQTGRTMIRGFTHGEKCFLELDSNTKTTERMASKSTTKVEIDPYDIKDIYRARIVVDSEKNIDEVITFLCTKFGKKDSQKSNSWKLEVKQTERTNVNADTSRKEVKVLGSFPLPGNPKIRIPIEIQIMTQENFDQNEAGANHHDVYVAIQTLVEDSRPTEAIDKGSYESIIKELVNTPNVYRSYPDYTERKKRKFQSRLEQEIRERMRNYFFERKDGYYAYQHVVRLRNISDVVKREDEAFRYMTEKLNIDCGTKLHAQDWKMLFDNPEQLSPQITFERIGMNIFKWAERISEIKWDVDFDPEIIIKSFVLHLNTRFVMADRAFWNKVIQGTKLNTKSEKGQYRNLLKDSDFKKIHGYRGRS